MSQPPAQHSDPAATAQKSGETPITGSPREEGSVHDSVSENSLKGAQPWTPSGSIRPMGNKNSSDNNANKKKVAPHATAATGAGADGGRSNSASYTSNASYADAAGGPTMSLSPVQKQNLKQAQAANAVPSLPLSSPEFAANKEDPHTAMKEIPITPTRASRYPHWNTTTRDVPLNRLPTVLSSASLPLLLQQQRQQEQRYGGGGGDSGRFSPSFDRTHSFSGRSLAGGLTPRDMAVSLGSERSSFRLVRAPGEQQLLPPSDQDYDVCNASNNSEPMMGDMLISTPGSAMLEPGSAHVTGHRRHSSLDDSTAGAVASLTKAILNLSQPHQHSDSERSSFSAGELRTSQSFRLFYERNSSPRLSNVCIPGNGLRPSDALSSDSGNDGDRQPLEALLASHPMDLDHTARPHGALSAAVAHFNSSTAESTHTHVSNSNNNNNNNNTNDKDGTRSSAGTGDAEDGGAVSRAGSRGLRTDPSMISANSTSFLLGPSGERPITAAPMDHALSFHGSFSRPGESASRRDELRRSDERNSYMGSGIAGASSAVQHPLDVSEANLQGLQANPEWQGSDNYSNDGTNRNSAEVNGSTLGGTFGGSGSPLNKTVSIPATFPCPFEEMEDLVEANRLLLADIQNAYYTIPESEAELRRLALLAIPQLVLFMDQLYTVVERPPEESRAPSLPRTEDALSSTGHRRPRRKRKLNINRIRTAGGAAGGVAGAEHHDAGNATGDDSDTNTSTITTTSSADSTSEEEPAAKEKQSETTGDAAGTGAGEKTNAPNSGSASAPSHNNHNLHLGGNNANAAAKKNSCSTTASHDQAMENAEEDGAATATGGTGAGCNTYASPTETSNTYRFQRVMDDTGLAMVPAVQEVQALLEADLPGITMRVTTTHWAREAITNLVQKLEDTLSSLTPINAQPSVRAVVVAALTALGRRPATAQGADADRCPPWTWADIVDWLADVPNEIENWVEAYPAAVADANERLVELVLYKALLNRLIASNNTIHVADLTSAGDRDSNGDSGHQQQQQLGSGSLFHFMSDDDVESCMRALVDGLLVELQERAAHSAAVTASAAAAAGAGYPSSVVGGGVLGAGDVTIVPDLPSWSDVQQHFSDISDRASWQWWFANLERLSPVLVEEPTYFENGILSLVDVALEQDDSGIALTQHYAAVARHFSAEDRGAVMSSLNKCIRVSTRQLTKRLKACRKNTSRALSCILRRIIVTATVRNPAIRQSTSPFELMMSHLYSQYESVRCAGLELELQKNTNECSIDILNAFVTFYTNGGLSGAIAAAEAAAAAGGLRTTSHNVNSNSSQGQPDKSSSHNGHPRSQEGDTGSADRRRRTDGKAPKRSSFLNSSDDEGAANSRKKAISSLSPRNEVLPGPVDTTPMEGGVPVMSGSTSPQLRSARDMPAGNAEGGADAGGGSSINASGEAHRLPQQQQLRQQQSPLQPQQHLEVNTTPTTDSVRRSGSINGRHSSSNDVPQVNLGSATPPHGSAQQGVSEARVGSGGGGGGVGGSSAAAAAVRHRREQARRTPSVTINLNELYRPSTCPAVRAATARAAQQTANNATRNAQQQQQHHNSNEGGTTTNTNSSSNNGNPRATHVLRYSSACSFCTTHSGYASGAHRTQLFMQLVASCSQIIVALANMCTAPHHAAGTLTQNQNNQHHINSNNSTMNGGARTARVFASGGTTNNCGLCSNNNNNAVNTNYNNNNNHNNSYNNSNNQSVMAGASANGFLFGASHSTSAGAGGNLNHSVSGTAHGSPIAVDLMMMSATGTQTADNFFAASYPQPQTITPTSNNNKSTSSSPFAGICTVLGHSPRPHHLSNANASPLNNSNISGANLNSNSASSNLAARGAFKTTDTNNNATALTGTLGGSFLQGTLLTSGNNHSNNAVAAAPLTMGNLRESSSMRPGSGSARGGPRSISGSCNNINLVAASSPATPVITGVINPSASAESAGNNKSYNPGVTPVPNITGVANSAYAAGGGWATAPNTARRYSGSARRGPSLHASVAGGVGLAFPHPQQQQQQPSRRALERLLRSLQEEQESVVRNSAVLNDISTSMGGN